MTARNLSKLSPGDRLKIKKGYVGCGKSATFVCFSDVRSLLCVILPNDTEFVIRHQAMFSERIPANEGDKP